MPRSATLARIASTIRAALSLGQLARDWERRLLHRGAILVARPRLGDASSRGRRLNDESAPAGRPHQATCVCAAALRGGDRTRRRSRRRAGRRRVLELLLGAEQGVEHLGAELLAERPARAPRRRTGAAACGRGARLRLRFLGASVRLSVASRIASAASRRSAWSFLSSSTAFCGRLPFCSRS